MDSNGKQGREELPVSLEHENVWETKVKVSPPTAGNDNPKLGTDALTRLVRKVLEVVFEPRVKANDETIQARCLEFSKKRDHSLLKQEPHSRYKTSLVETVEV
ncbi:hypothetical protein J1N35_034868 [Gossypium stocksii]|uniref:Uncharacterized protein n=1 Tax=Gossypium stocksii TaxID=47602 RepID=A0A9D3USX7_9ROSI|nr:hypothetical protein J1N35_034868 [Gossypium stocksii]